MRPKAARQGLIEVFGELGEAGAGNHEGDPSAEYHQCPGPNAVGRRYTIAGQSRLHGPLSEPGADKAETNPSRRTPAVLVVQQGG